jgi:hypothetical protein
MATIAATEDIKSDANELANIAIEHKIYTHKPQILSNAPEVFK